MKLLDLDTGLPSLWGCVKSYMADKTSHVHTVSATSSSNDGNNTQDRYLTPVYWDGDEKASRSDLGVELLFIDIATGGVTNTHYYTYQGHTASGTTVAEECEKFCTALSEKADDTSCICVVVTADAFLLSSDMAEALKAYGGGADLDTFAATFPANYGQRKTLAFIGQAGMDEGTAWYSYSLTAGEQSTVTAVVANGVLLPSCAIITEEELEAVCV